MTISEQLKFVKEQLAPWAAEVKGRVEIAADAVHLLGILATTPGAPRVVILFDGEEKRGEFEELGRVDRKFMVVVSRGRGFKLDPGGALTEGVAGGKPLYDLYEECREMVRAMVFDRETTEGIPNFTGGSRFSLEEATVDALQINFTIGVQLPLHHQEEETE
jgi:hypothetical protein